jgi:hypothetical protein
VRSRHKNNAGGNCRTLISAESGECLFGAHGWHSPACCGKKAGEGKKEGRESFHVATKREIGLDYLNFSFVSTKNHTPIGWSKSIIHLWTFKTQQVFQQNAEVRR